MKRQRKRAFYCESMETLSKQLAYAPREHQIRQLARAEKLHDELLGDPDGGYPLAYLHFRITGQKAIYKTEETLFGEAVAHDLREIIDQLSKPLELQVDPADPCMDTQSLAEEKKVATRTIARWRESGLRWRWGRLKEGGYFQVLFPASAIVAFDAAHGDRVARAAAFSQLSADEHRRLLARARRLAEATGETPFAIARHIARRTGRATESLRLILLRHDREDPADPIFKDYSAPLSEAQRDELFRLWESRVPTRELCRKFQRTRTGIYRAVSGMRAEKLAQVRAPFHFIPTFERPDAAEVYLSAPLEEFIPPSFMDGPRDLPDILRPWFTAAPISEDRENRLLLRQNFLKYRFSEDLKRLQSGTLTMDKLAAAETALCDMRLCRAAIARLALPVAHSMANRHLAQMKFPDARMREETLLRLLSVALPVAEDTIDAFDPASAKTSFLRHLGNRILQRFSALHAEPASEADRAPMADLTQAFRARLTGLASLA